MTEGRSCPSCSASRRPSTPVRGPAAGHRACVSQRARGLAPDVMVLMSADNDPKAARDGDYLQDAAADSVLPAGHRGRRPGVRADLRPLRRLGRADHGQQSAKEFEDTEKMIGAAEKLYGEYRWGRYDMLVLPPSFPFGGMENPRLTFATPTVIVGDKSLVSLVAHELAHSWSGNLVTNASWKDIWLNEGFTTYVQGRITEALYGKGDGRDGEADRPDRPAGRSEGHEPGRPGAGAAAAERARPRRSAQPGRRQGCMVPGVPGAALRPRDLRSVPARLVR